MESISSVKEDRLVCPVRALRYYLSRTKTLQNSQRLFISSVAPHAPVSKDTISRWIKSLISLHSQPSERVRAHDVQAHATSKTWFAGIPLEDIIKAAGWKMPSSFVSHYLTDTVSAEGAFAKAVLTRRTSVLPVHNNRTTHLDHVSGGQPQRQQLQVSRRGSSSVPAIPPSVRCQSVQ